MKEVIAKLLKACPGAETEYFESSDWFEDDESPAAIKKTIKAYEKHYERRLKELTKLLGEPIQTDSTHRKAISRWYPEAMRAACWIKDGKTLCLALEQHDRETPVCVLLRCLSPEEIDELSA
jgi:hypothetical protein